MSETSQARALHLGVESNRYIENVNRWAIIVGISEYKFDGLNLKYAHHDASELYELIRTPSGGAFEEKRICKFINEEATTKNITRALRSFLQKPAVEDIVLIFFACHGAPDPQRTNVVYLLTHDTNPEDIPGTGLPMREIDSALRDNLRAERVVIIADTCHSAAVGGKIGRRSIGDPAIINRYLQDLSETTPGLALLTSAQTNESALEGGQWGGGHGVFTHFLLEGMRGKADRNPKNGTVTVGELFEYVRDEVKRDTNDAQHPVIGTNPFDPMLPLAITGGISSEEHFELGRCLNRLGRLLDDPKRFEFAHLQLREALALAKRFREKLPQAQLQKGLAEMALSDNTSAESTFRQTIKDDKEQTIPEAHLHLGVALARLGRTKKAASALRKFVQLRPEDARANWVQGFVARLAGEKTSGQTHVLLIGIGDYKEPGMRLQGPGNDIAMMRDLLVGHYKIAENSIHVLTNSDATHQAIVAEFERLQKTTKPNDQVLVYFSGHAFQGDVTENYLIPYDYDQDDPHSVTAQQLHDLLNAIPSLLTTAIIDSHATRKFVALAKHEARYRLLLGTSPELQAYEGQSDEGLPMGQFTAALVKQLAQHPADAPLDNILDSLGKMMTQLGNPQTPVIIGDTSVGLLTAHGIFNVFLEGYEFSLRRNYDALSLGEIRTRHKRLCQQGISFLQLDISFGRAFLEKRHFSEALNVLEGAANGDAEQVPEALLILAIAKLHCQDYDGALASLNSFASQNIDAQKQLDEPILTMKELNNQRKHALLVGIDRYQMKDTAPLRGAVNDAELVKRTLIEQCDFAEENIQLITDEDATRGAIDAAFAELVGTAQHGPALFYFSGYGSRTLNGDPTIVPVDRDAVSYPNDISLRELAGRSAATATNLVTIIDAGWQESIQLPYGGAWGRRFAPPQSGTRPLMRGLSIAGTRINVENSHQDWEPDPGWTSRREWVQHHIGELKIGRHSIFHVSIQSGFGDQRGQGGEAVVEAEFSSSSGSENKIHGVMTHALMDVLRSDETCALTYGKLAAEAGKLLKWLQPFAVGSNMAEALFSAPVQEQKVHDLVYTRFEQNPIRQAIHLLNRLIEQAGGKHAFGNLNLGVAHAAIKEYKESRSALEKAIVESGKDPIPEAHYYLGRVLYEMDQELDLAISELRRAMNEDPENIAANYYFGHAVRERTERKTLREAIDAFNVYLHQGAPLGKRDEVEAVLQRWSDRGSGSGSGAGIGLGAESAVGFGHATDSGTGTGSGY